VLKLSELYIDQEVHWTDPCELHGHEHSSGTYMVAFINSDADDVGNPDRENDDDILVLLRNNVGTEVEVFNSELTYVD